MTLVKDNSSNRLFHSKEKDVEQVGVILIRNLPLPPSYGLFECGVDATIVPMEAEVAQCIIVSPLMHMPMENLEETGKF